MQGVFFRASTARFAQSRGLRGTAVNLPDGRVRVDACGGTDELAALELWLHHGPQMARVDRVVASDRECVASTDFSTA